MDHRRLYEIKIESLEQQIKALTKGQVEMQVVVQHGATAGGTLYSTKWGGEAIAPLAPTLLTPLV